MLLRKTHLTLLHDISIAAASFIFSMYLRLGSEFDILSIAVIDGLIIFTVISAAVLVALRIPMRVWKYTSTQDLSDIIKAVSLIVVLFMLVMFAYNRLDGIPRSLIVINWLVLLAMLGAPRFIYRAIKERNIKINLNKANKINIILIGATDHSEQFLRLTSGNKQAEYRVVGIIDEDKNRHDRYIHNVKIFGGLHDIEHTINELTKRGKTPQKIVIAPDVIKGNDISFLLDISEKCGLTMCRLPRITDFDTASLDTKIPLRPIVLEDLLGRPQNTLNRDEMRNLVEDKRVMITGAGGTIGSELVRQIAKYKPAHICLFDSCEYNLYTIDLELTESFPDVEKTPVIGDIRDRKKIDISMEGYMPQIVFHAAALKHVPMSETNIGEAILTNIIGSRNIADACVAHNVEEVVMISTDKAVNPTNIMGATKRIAESYIQALGNSKKSNITKFATIRFGNVLGSTGSVIPRFKKQLENGGPLTVTDKKIERYFMTVREAVELVLQTAALAAKDTPESSKIFVLDMGKPVLIDDLARKLILLAGLQPDIDIKIEYTGLRPGEKLFEELFHGEEKPVPTGYKDIMVANVRETPLAELTKAIKKLETTAITRNNDKAIEAIQKILPEYQRNSS